MKNFWKTKWNEMAQDDDILGQTGRKGSNLVEFFLMMKDVTKPLELKISDTLLDIGGGVGLVSIYLSPFVKKITLIDYAGKIVQKARETTKYFPNIEVFQDNILTLNKISGKNFSKIIVGSVLQYLEDYDEVKIGLKNVFNALLPDGKAIFTYNPDLRKKSAHIKSYGRLAWSKKQIDKALDIEEKRLWLAVEKIKQMSLAMGFSACYEVPINSKIWQSKHMFNLIVEK